MVRKSGIGDVQFILNVADYQSLRMSGEQGLHDAQARFRAHGGKHVGVTGDISRASSAGLIHISMGNGNTEIVKLFPRLRTPSVPGELKSMGLWRTRKDVRII